MRARLRCAVARDDALHGTESLRDRLEIEDLPFGVDRSNSDAGPAGERIFGVDADRAGGHEVERERSDVAEA